MTNDHLSIFKSEDKIWLVTVVSHSLTRDVSLQEGGHSISYGITTLSVFERAIQ